MINLGNTCFFNSIMQNLLAMGRLRDSFLNLDTPVGPLISSLKKLFTETNPESGLKTTINPRSFFGCVCSKSPQFRGYQQHDSHELLHCLLDGLSTEEQAARKQNGSSKRDDNPANTLVDDLFGGQISSTVRCIECGNSSTVYEPFLDLSLPVPTKKPPPRKVQQATRTKKAKLPPRKGGKARVKVNRDDDPVASQSISNQSSVHESTSCAQSNVSVAGEMAVPSDSGDSTVLGSEEISNVSKELSSPNLVAVGESHDMQVLDNDANKMSASSDDLAWLDYLEAGDDAEICEFLPPKEDAQDTEGRDEPLNELLGEGSCESNGPKYTPNEDQDQRPDSSTNGWEDEVPPQVQGSEVLLLPYKEESSSACEITGRDGEASCSNLGSGQEELAFDGFGDLFNEPEPEVFVGPAPRPSSSEVTETVFNSESDPDEVDDTDSPVSVESCLAHFIKPELLLDENGWNCENCSKIVRRQKREAKRKAKSVLDGIETGCRDEPLNETNSFSIEVRSLDNGNITDTKNTGSSVSHINRGTELENGQTNGLSSIVDGKDHVTSKMKDTLDEELQSSGCHNSSNAESCNHSAADASVTLDNTENVESRDPQMSGQDDDDSEEECSEEEADAKSLKVKRDATKRVLIHKAPPVLTIHLKRFSQDARGRLSKLNGHVNFKDRMDLRPYMDPRYVGEEKYEYHLVGVVEHSGSMRGGHYVAYVRGGQRNRGKADNDENKSSTWYHASDAYVREVSLDEVLRCEAYILFYEKI
ncbi:ubiquitin-specific protease ubp2 [Stylosanthes scabra]|uniref:Ubiquitin-specific protease ubp2 n=1 Tax=Stylosanthes scabra TaxID=79078 RepID=A0ABU6YJ52_9FABA|nr:ubiquitin-specific protease ubp2 [Stylosanthes scabra]